MKFRYLPALMTLLAGAIVSIFSFIHRDELIMFLFKTVVAMAIFFTLGVVLRAAINFVLREKKDKQTEEQIQAPEEQTDSEKTE
ncbi:MAG: DUF1418 family protein [Lachnospiraceae bacterium]|nr:hypothetical protein [Lachnospira sp.]MBR6697373.1 DUF1418 family protein [Lachnospiraceae bacterium]